MRLSKISSETGTAVLEVITFVLVGQLLVMGWLIQLAEQLDHKTRLQLFAISMARSVSLGHTELETAMKEDLGLVGAKMQNFGCNEPLVCVQAVEGGMKTFGVSHK
jgi:predicted Kef-type K+ transport protein